jgi:uncharacterized protein with GYD domain
VSTRLLAPFPQSALLLYLLKLLTLCPADDGARACVRASVRASPLPRREKKEAAVLEDFTQRVEKNLEQTTKRAAAAEAQVAALQAELKRYKVRGRKVLVRTLLREAVVDTATISRTRFALAHAHAYAPP